MHTESNKNETGYDHSFCNNKRLVLHSAEAQRHWRCGDDVMILPCWRYLGCRSYVRSSLTVILLGMRDILILESLYIKYYILTVAFMELKKYNIV